jgi:hypothetical protein
MGSLSRRLKTGGVLRGLLLCLALVTNVYSGMQSDSQTFSNHNSRRTSSATEGSFPCIQAAGQTRQSHRVALLHGPDWVITSSIEPSCLPERDVVFAARVGEGLIPHPFTARTRLWVKRDPDVAHIRIVESSGNEEQDMVAASFVTNHKCVKRSSKNCSIKGGAALGPID